MSEASSEMKCVEGEKATSIESEEPTWEDLDDEDAELPEFEVDEWKTSLPESKITHSWSVEIKVEIFKPERFVFRGLSRKMPKGTRKWKTTPLEISKKQLKKGCLVSGGLESLAHSLGIRCDEVTGLLLVLSLFKRWDLPEVYGIDDMIRYLIIPIVIEQKKVQLLALSREKSHYSELDSVLTPKQMRIEYLKSKPTNLKYSQNTDLLKITKNKKLLKLKKNKKNY